MAVHSPPAGTSGGAISGTTGTFSSLTSGRVALVGTAGLLQDSANLLFNSGTGALSVTGSITDSGLTSGRITFASTAGLLADSANFLYSDTGGITGPGATVGSGSTTSMGWIFGYAGFSGRASIWATSSAKGNNDYALQVIGNDFYVNAPGTNGVVYLNANGNSAGLKLDTVNTTFQPQTNGAIDLGKAAVGWKRVYLDYTITAAASTGNKTINKAAGSIRIAAAGTTVTLTNSLVTANSIVMAQLSTVDTTAKSVVCSVSSTSVLFTLNAAATAEVEIRWAVISTD